MDQHDIAGGALHVWGALHVCLPPLVIPWCLLPTPPQSIMYGQQIYEAPDCLPGWMGVNVISCLASGV